MRLRAHNLVAALAAALLLAGAAAGIGSLVAGSLAAALLAGGIFQVLFGAQEQIRGARTLWGVDIPVSPRLHGTFVNPNHLALYLEMALPIVFAWGWWALRRAADQPQIERRLLIVAPPVMLWLTLFLGLSFSNSRAGLLAAVAAVTVQGLLVARARRRWWVAPLGAALALAGLLVVASAGLREGGLGRLLATSASDVSWGSRLREYGAELEIWGRFPVTGSGLGTFRDVFPLVQTPDLDGTFWHPHSDLLEVLVTAGLLGTALLAAGLLVLLRRLAAVLARGGRSEDRAAALAAFGVLASVGLHEAVDFGLTMPGNALTLAVLLGAVTTARVQQERSAQLDVPGEDLPAPALDTQEVEPAPERRHHSKRRRRSRKRPDRKGAHGGAVEA